MQTLTVSELCSYTFGHLAHQGQKSTNEVDNERPPGCSYRHNGLKCAAGFWIPDELYTLTLEGKGVTHYRVRESLDPQIEWTVELFSMLEKLQAFHDSSYVWFSPEAFYAAMMQFIYDHDISSYISTPDNDYINGYDILAYVKKNWKMPIEDYA